MEDRETVKVPNIEDTGATGTQAPSGTDYLPVEIMRPMEELSVSHTIEGLASSKPKYLSDFSARLLAAVYKEYCAEHTETVRQLREANDEIRKLNTLLSEYREKKAILEERIKSLKRERKIQNVCMAVGGILITISLHFLNNSLLFNATIVGTIGLGLLLYGWFSGDREKGQ